VVFIRSVHGRFGEPHLGSLYMVHPKETNFNARTHIFWNNALIFMLLGFFYLSGGSIWVNALPDTLLESNQYSLR